MTKTEETDVAELSTLFKDGNQFKNGFGSIAGTIRHQHISDSIDGKNEIRSER